MGNLYDRHQLAHRMAILMAHMLKWKCQSDRRREANLADLPKDREWAFGLVLKEDYLPS